MERENVVYIHNGVLVSCKELQNYVARQKMNGNEEQLLFFFTVESNSLSNTSQ
jgi:hypothetical protein